MTHSEAGGEGGAGEGSVGLSVVIPAHNAAKTLAAQLDAVLAQCVDEPFEVVVVDNASNDGTAALVEARAAGDPRVRLVRATSGRGPSYARNVGVSEARGERVVCCDADDVVSPGWLAALATALRTQPFVGGRLAFDLLNDAEQVEGRGGNARAEPGTLGNLRFAHGCNIGFQRDLYRDAGGLNEQLIAGEEIDLAIRLATRGVLLTEVPDAVIQYRYRTSARAQWNQAFEHGRVAPYLCKALRASGLTTPSRLDGLRIYWWLLRAVPRLRSRALRIRWRYVLASRCGRFAGCLRYRTVFL